MSRVEFGVMIRQEKTDFETILNTAKLCDDLGYDSIWFYDHLLGMGLVEQDILESWTLMSALSAVTKNVKLGTMVLCNSFRHPALLAKMGATLDVISGGRLEFTIGAGWFEPEFKAYGFPFLDTVTRIEQLSEGVQIIKRMWDEENVNFTGKHYEIVDAYCNPKPIQQPHPPITVGGSGEKHLLRVVAEHADGWNCPATHAGEFDKKIEVLTRHCEDAGRDIKDIIISEQTVCVIAEKHEEVIPKLEQGKRRYGFFGDIEKAGIVGTPEICIKKIEEKAQKGVKKFTIFFSDMNNPETLTLFAERVMPNFR